MLKCIKNIILAIFLCSCDFSPRIHRDILYAQELIKLQNYEKSVQVYERILEKNVSKEIKVKVLYQLSQLYSVYLGQHEKAIHSLQMIKLVSDSPATQVEIEERMGEINFKYLNNYLASIENYLNLTKFTPKLQDYDFYRLRLAMSYLKANNYEKANELFIDISENGKEKDQIESLYYLGIMQFHQKKWPETISILKEYIKREERKVRVIQARFLIANAYETMEKLKSAYDMYYSLLGDYPNTEVIKNRLNSIYARRIARKR